MLWWIAAAMVWLISAAGIFYVMADVIRGKYSPFSKKVVPAYAFHGITAILAIVLLFKAINS